MHKSKQEIEELINSIPITVGEVYQHYKTQGLYRIQSISLIVNSNFKFYVNYYEVDDRGLVKEPDIIFSREASEFLATVKDGNGNDCDRFIKT